MKKILILGNSFGSDSSRYVYGISRAAGEEVKIVNLYIGGCSLYRHYRNMLSGEKAYHFILDGIESGIFVSLGEALLSDEWDYVVMHQCSLNSGEYDTFFPYLPELAAYVKKLAPRAELYMQMTWTFEEGHSRFTRTPFRGRADMIPAIRDAYTRAAEKIGCRVMIPTLDAMCRLYDEIGPAAYRDGFHCSYGVGRYLIGCLWFMVFFGRDIEGNSFRDFDVEVSEEEVMLAQKIARETLLEKGFSLR